MLGVGSYTVALAERGGRIVGELPWSDLRFTRRLSETGDCSVGCGIDGLPPAASRVDGWDYELVVHRDDDPGWAGPVLVPQYGTDTVRFTARDLTAWWEHRELPDDYVAERRDLARIFEDVAGLAMVRDPSPAVTVRRDGLLGVLGSRNYPAADHRRIADLLRELGRSGVVWSAAGRTVHVGPAGAVTLPTLLDDHVRDPVLAGDGVGTSTETTVIGGKVDGRLVVATATAESDEGLLQSTFTEPEILDPGSALASARARTGQRPAVRLTASLTPDAPVRFTDLVPGAWWPVRLTVGVRQVDTTLLLTQVDVTPQAAQQGTTDQITVTLQTERT